MTTWAISLQEEIQGSVTHHRRYPRLSVKQDLPEKDFDRVPRCAALGLGVYGQLTFAQYKAWQILLNCRPSGNREHWSKRSELAHFCGHTWNNFNRNVLKGLKELGLVVETEVTKDLIEWRVMCPIIEITREALQGPEVVAECAAEEEEGVTIVAPVLTPENSSRYPGWWIYADWEGMLLRDRMIRFSEVCKGDPEALPGWLQDDLMNRDLNPDKVMDRIEAWLRNPVTEAVAAEEDEPRSTMAVAFNIIRPDMQGGRWLGEYRFSSWDALEERLLGTPGEELLYADTYLKGGRKLHEWPRFVAEALA